MIQEAPLKMIDQSDPNAPNRIPSQYFKFSFDLAILDQKLPEMSDSEILAANHANGGFNWLEDSSEDIYKE